MRVATRILVAVAWALALALSAAKAADYHHVIFIPGTLGSRLVNSDGDLVWGSVGATQLRFEQLTFPLDKPKGTLKPDGLLKDVSLYFGWYKVQAYGSMSEFLTRTVPADRYHEFAYDWRQSNFTTACDLVKYIGKNRALAQAAESPEGITLVTHSMGGIVGRAFLSYWTDKDTQPTATNPCPHKYNVSLFLPIAAPFNGAGQALKSFTDGMAPYWKLIRPSSAAINRVFFSLPSVYELLPRYPGCCMATVGGKNAPVDLFATSEWSAYGWIPTSDVAEFRTPQFKKFMQDRLASTQRLTKVIADKLPPGTRLFSISGFNQNTSTYVKLAPRGGTNVWSNAADGDETVPEVSALPGIGIGRWRVPNSHVGLMADERVHKLVKFALEKYGSTVVGPRALPEDGTEEQVPEDLKPFLVGGEFESRAVQEGIRKIAFVDLPATLPENSGQELTFTVTDTVTKQAARDLEVGDITVTVETSTGANIDTDVDSEGDGVYRISFRTPKGPEVCSIGVSLAKGNTPFESRAEEMVVIPEGQ